MNPFMIFTSFLLAVVVAVSGAPRQDTQDTRIQALYVDVDKAELDADVNLEEILEADPSIKHQIDPDLVPDVPWIDVEVEREVVAEILRRFMEEEETRETAEKDGYDASAVRHRRRRQTEVSGDVNVDKQRGSRRITGTLNLDHAINSKHSIGGNLGIGHTKISGLGSGTDYQAGLNYKFTPNKKTSLSLGASKNWGSSGRGTTFGINFSHSFGRKRRSPDRVKLKCRSNGACKLKIRGRRRFSA